MATTAIQIEGRLNRARGAALVLGVIGLVLCGMGASASPTQFYRSYLLAYMFWIGLGLGCLGITMLQHLVGGEWGLLIRRLLESGAKTLIPLAVLFIPIVLGLSRLYVWAQPAVVAGDPILQHRQFYLNPQFFVVRAVIYFVLWILLVTLLNKWSVEQDRTGSSAVGRRMGRMSAPGLIVFFLTVTFAVIDWVMSLEPHWFSTIYGLLFVVVMSLSAMAFCIIILMMLSETDPISRFISPKRLNDVGTLLFAFVMLWAYLSFSQFLIIWSANLKDEIPWYLTRNNGGWGWMAIILVFCHFAIPFLLLVIRALKRRVRLLAIVAFGLLLMTVVDLFWLIVPGFGLVDPQVHWMDLMAFIGIGGLWLAMFFSQLKKKPLLPLHDCRYEGLLNEGMLSHAD